MKCLEWTSLKVSPTEVLGRDLRDTWNFTGWQRGAFDLWRSTKGSRAWLDPRNVRRNKKESQPSETRSMVEFGKLCYGCVLCLGIFRSIISLWVNPGWWHWMWKITCIILIKTEFANCLLLSEQSFFFNSLFGGRLAHSTPLEPPAFIPNSWSQHLLQLHL